MQPSPHTRPSLLLRVRNADDTDAWEQFVDLYTPLVFNFCRSRGLQEADAADVAQEVMRAIARAIGSFDYRPQPNGFRAWLFTITRNKFNTFLTKRGREPQGTGDTAVRAYLEAQPCPEQDESWDKEYHRRLFEWACGQVRGEFSEKTWPAFWRTSVQEESGAEVARAGGLSAGGVYVARRRGRPRLRDCLAAHEEDDVPPSPAARPAPVPLPPLALPALLPLPAQRPAASLERFSGGSSINPW